MARSLQLTTFGMRYIFALIIAFCATTAPPSLAIVLGSDPCLRAFFGGVDFELENPVKFDQNRLFATAYGTRWESVLGAHTIAAFDWAATRRASGHFSWQRELAEMQWPDRKESSNTDLILGSSGKPYPAEPVKGTGKPIWLVTTEKSKFYFFPEYTYGARAWKVVENIRAALKSNAYPQSYIGALNGERGVYVEEAPGNPLGGYTGLVHLKSMEELMAMDFLVGHLDTHSYNIHVSENGDFSAFDFETVLDEFPGTLGVRTHPFGQWLPLHYSKTFLQSLRDLTPQSVLKRWPNVMSQRQVEIFLYNREIILHDAQVRGF
jgi:hypothetical protein